MYRVDAVMAAEPYETWDSAFQSLHGRHLASRPGVTSPARELVWQRTDHFTLAWCGGAQQSFARQPRHVRTDPRGTFELLVPLRGTAVARVGDAVAEVGPGTATLCDGDRPLHFSHGADFASLALVVPQSEVSARDPALGTATSVLDTSKGLGALIRTMAMTLHDQRATLDEQAFEASCAGLIDLACLAAAGSTVPPSPAAASVADAVRRYIRDHAQEPDLDVRRIALALGWSTRHIQAVLQAGGTTARDLIRGQRLELAHVRLTSPGWSGVPIGDIALASGFSSHALFATSFRARFGMTPRAARLVDGAATTA